MENKVPINQNDILEQLQKVLKSKSKKDKKYLILQDELKSKNHECERLRNRIGELVSQEKLIQEKNRQIEHYTKELQNALRTIREITEESETWERLYKEIKK